MIKLQTAAAACLLACGLLAFNSVHEGSRQIYLIDVKPGKAGTGTAVTSLNGEGWRLDGVPVSVPHTWNADDYDKGFAKNDCPRMTVDCCRCREIRGLAHHPSCARECK